MLPRNPQVMVSILNTKLRDFYSDLEELCDDLDENREEIVKYLGENGYFYDADKNQFREDL